MRGRMVGLLAAVLLTAGLGACSDDEDAATAPTTTTAPSPSTASTSPRTPTGEPIGEVLPDGEHHGFITRSQELDDGGYAVAFDLAYLLTGDEAAAAARADGVELETDYYVQNRNPRERDLPVFDPSEVEVTVTGEGDLCCEALTSDYGHLEGKVLDARAVGRVGPLVKVTIAGGRVARFDEVFLA